MKNRDVGVRRMFVSVLPLLAAALIVGCGSSNSTTSTTSTSSAPATSASSQGANSAAEALVPASIKSKGTITVAADATYAPDEFIGPDGHSVVGMDADLSKALGAVMGLKVNVVNATFDSIIPGLASGKYDIGASSFTDTKEREKTVDFVDYFVAGESFYTKASGGTTISGLADLCGKSVAVETGTIEKDDATKQSQTCTKEGKQAVHVLVFPDQN